MTLFTHYFYVLRDFLPNGQDQLWSKRNHPYRARRFTRNYYLAAWPQESNSVQLYGKQTHQPTKLTRSWATYIILVHSLRLMWQKFIILAYKKEMKDTHFTRSTIHFLLVNAIIIHLLLFFWSFAFATSLSSFHTLTIPIIASKQGPPIPTFWDNRRHL